MESDWAPGGSLAPVEMPSIAAATFGPSFLRLPFPCPTLATPPVGCGSFYAGALFGLEAKRKTAFLGVRQIRERVKLEGRIHLVGSKRKTQSKSTGGGLIWVCVQIRPPHFSACLKLQRGTPIKQTTNLA